MMLSLSDTIPKGTRRYAALRSMTTDYKGEATGSDKHFSFALVADDRPVREVHVFEAAIDAMSYASLKIMYHKDWRKKSRICRWQACSRVNERM